jgi:broad specificity phosphatase PhoE
VTLLFVRHGESTWNVEGRFQGRKDPPLSDLGERQARALAQRLASPERPGAIVSSPLARARRTAELIGAACDLPIALDERLVEISHGEWEGLLRTEIAARWPGWLERWQTSPQSVRFPNGENLEQVQARFESFMGDVAERKTPLVVCTHDVIIRLATLWADGQPMARFSALKSDNAAITEIAFRDGLPRLVRANDSGHLDGLRSDLARQAL